MRPGVAQRAAWPPRSAVGAGWKPPPLRAGWRSRGGAGLGAAAGEPKKGREASADVVTAELGRPCICSGLRYFEV